MTEDGADLGDAPPAVIEWMERFGRGESGADPRSAREAGLEALREALSRTGRNREGAFALLAADGLLTRAVEEALESSDSEGELRRLLDEVSEAGSEEPG